MAPSRVDPTQPRTSCPLTSSEYERGRRDFEEQKQIVRWEAFETQMQDGADVLRVAILVIPTETEGAF